MKYDLYSFQFLMTLNFIYGPLRSNKYRIMNLLTMCLLKLGNLLSGSVHYSPSVCDLALFNLFISSVFNVVNTHDNIQVIFPMCV